MMNNTLEIIYITLLALATTSFVLLTNIEILFYCETLPLENSRNCPLIKGHKLLLWVWWRISLAMIMLLIIIRWLLFYNTM